MVRDEFSERSEHAALLRAVSAAGAWCDEPRHRPELAKLLSRKEYLDVPELALLPALCGPFAFDEERRETLQDLLIFHKGNAQYPAQELAHELQRELIAAGLITVQPPAELCQQLFREELHAAALGLSPTAAELA